MVKNIKNSNPKIDRIDIISSNSLSFMAHALPNKIYPRCVYSPMVYVVVPPQFFAWNFITLVPVARVAI